MFTGGERGLLIGDKYYKFNYPYRFSKNWEWYQFNIVYKEMLRDIKLDNIDNKGGYNSIDTINSISNHHMNRVLNKYKDNPPEQLALALGGEW